MIAVFKNNVQKAWIVSGLFVLALVVVVASFPAAAQTNWETQNRIKRLENEIETLSRAIYKGETPPPGTLPMGGGSNADTEVRLQQIESDMRDLRGLLERQSYETRQLKSQLERMSSDMELRMNDLEKTRTSSGAASAGNSGQGAMRYTTMDNMPAASGAGEAGVVSNGYQWNSQDNRNTAGATQQLGSYTQSASNGAVTGSGDVAATAYERAFSLIKDRQYDQAQRQFDAFLQTYPGHPLAGNAQYWLGETYYVRGDFAEASRVFAEGYQKYPKSSKTPDNLLKLGLSLDALGKQKEACIALSQLKKENPAGAAPVLQRADQELSRLGC